ncbi:hypothetical protein [Burkholderia sp. Ac-20365]|jgi:hypothetical protein|uniref:hypothetical protein n=1 Tax=Burkholderia sp. Ac-20365 TaxID=2703897 RepID=UPI00197B5EEC|nr:hypothetical protein [Burkholderia sp. Ac-20365]MBN3767640.1 hypothetical protein [Burkholderia sp. Ac-20365]
MTDTEFEQWRKALLSMDRYENPTDARTFAKLAKDVQAQLDGRVIDTLLDTFCDDDDYGIQESILVVLDKADAKLYAERLAFKFPDLLRNASAQEWPHILIGRVVNSSETEKIREIVDVARRTQGQLDKFIHSEDFLNEYPEISTYF